MTVLRWHAMIAFVLAVGQMSFLAAESTRARITFPSEGGIMTGPVTLTADVQATAAITDAVFFVDGREVCVISKLPIQCDWDAGPAVIARHVRLVVNFAGGQREVRNVRTVGIAYAETVDVDVVQVSVTVTDEDGQYVKGLPQSAFHVTENGRPQAISHFYSQDAPLELVVALDVSASMGAAMPAMKKAACGLLAAVPPSHRVTMLAFNDEVFALAPRVSDPGERTKIVNRLIPWGGTALYESILRGVDILGVRPGRKALLVFTDGEDRSSHATLDDVEDALHSNDLALYMIGQGSGLTRDSLKKVMQRLTKPTGGRMISTSRIEELQESFAELLAEMSNQYVIAYAPSNSARDGSWREISVRVDGYERVRAREGYRASARHTR